MVNIGRFKAQNSWRIERRAQRRGTSPREKENNKEYVYGQYMKL